ncbi:FeoA family protein [Rhodobacter maris]|uniref:Ferrous iron transport protein A n=1 Tax=Rhodobacter maris TaxID=446682 RepID=A0A285RN45_9RHOB|nr:FeoA family protein [Rhodobacter maris]SOB93717.1 ferrous iron transport protein A [Rhodobacter maris]
MNMPFHPDLQALPLALAPLGVSLEVRRLAGGQAFTQRMLAMGLGPGRVVQLIQREGSHVVLAIGETRFGIGRGVAQKILVTEIGEGRE